LHSPTLHYCMTVICCSPQIPCWLDRELSSKPPSSSHPVPRWRPRSLPCHSERSCASSSDHCTINTQFDINGMQHFPDFWSILRQYFPDDWSILWQYFPDNWSILWQYFPDDWSILWQYFPDFWSILWHFHERCYILWQLNPIYDFLVLLDNSFNGHHGTSTSGVHNWLEAEGHKQMRN